jgi:uncharacterized membrane protein YkvA (DUF1232 family)
MAMEQGPMTDDDDLDEAIKDTAEAGRGVSRDHAARFYDRVRTRIQDYLDNKGGMVEKTAEFLLLAPDMFILLWRLANDGRVSGKNKVLLGSGLAYFIFPFDILPEAFLGPIGYLDDLVFAVYVLNRMLTDTDPAILREHWSGGEDVFDAVRRVLASADQLVGSKVVAQIKKMVK